MLKNNLVTLIGNLIDSASISVGKNNVRNNNVEYIKILVIIR